MEEHERGRSRVGREEWRTRVERWRDSGLTAAEFAGELGINSRTLVYWKWALGRGEQQHAQRRERGAKGSRSGAVTKSAAASTPVNASLVEIQTSLGDARFELELARGRRLRVPASFDAEVLRRLLDVLEAT